MKRILLAASAALIFASPAVAQVAKPTSIGGGGSITVHSTKGTGTMRDTTAHTTLDNGTTVSTSTDNNDGETPNGGAGSGGNTSDDGEE